MKQLVTRFKTPQLGLKELEPFIRHGGHLSSGRGFKLFGNLRSRELLANWLLCAVANFANNRTSFTFTSDPNGGDGVIYDCERQMGWNTEHVMVPRATQGAASTSIEAAIASAVALKVKKGRAYASGKILVVFNESGLGQWHPNKAARALPAHDFDDVWVVGLCGQPVNGYVYSVSELSLLPGNAPTWLVHLSPDFQSWTVDRLQ